MEARTARILLSADRWARAALRRISPVALETGDEMSPVLPLEPDGAIAAVLYVRHRLIEKNVR